LAICRKADNPKFTAGTKCPKSNSLCAALGCSLVELGATRYPNPVVFQTGIV